jgi:hypothetical protein
MCSTAPPAHQCGGESQGENAVGARSRLLPCFEGDDPPFQLADLKQLDVELDQRADLTRFRARQLAVPTANSNLLTDGRESVDSSINERSLQADSSGPPADDAERRQVTVMFSDLVGTCARSFRPIRSPWPRPCSASEGSLRDTWATVSSCILVIPWLMRTTPSGPIRAGLELTSSTRL